MITVTSKNIKSAYYKALKNVLRLPDIKGDPKNYKDSSAVITLKDYKQEPLVSISHDLFKSKFDYEEFIPNGSTLMNDEIKHYNREFFLSGWLDETIKHLKKHPYSKKGVLSFWRGLRSGNNIPCVVYVWFRQRNDSLDMSCHMRANNAFTLLLMDMHIMTTVHDCVAEKLGLMKGDYCHFVDSLHLYRRDRKSIEKFEKYNL